MPELADSILGTKGGQAVTVQAGNESLELSNCLLQIVPILLCTNHYLTIITEFMIALFIYLLSSNREKGMSNI